MCLYGVLQEGSPVTFNYYGGIDMDSLMSTPEQVQRFGGWWRSRRALRTPSHVMRLLQPDDDDTAATVRSPLHCWCEPSGPARMMHYSVDHPRSVRIT
jgi:hypothetical protein